MNQSELFEYLLLNETFIAWVWSEGKENADYWKNWIKENPENEDVLLQARLTILELKENRQQLDVLRKNVLREKIQAITTQQEPPTSVESQTNTKSRKLVGLSMAAVVALIIGLGAIFTWWILQNDNSFLYQTAYGEIKTFLLPDSSLVTLNANSSLTYTYNEAENIREARLDGEGFFNIAKIDSATSAPFLVYTGNLSVRVLGTRFNVKHRRESTQVVLEEGSIQLALEDQKDAFLMRPDDLVEVEEGETVINQKVVEASKYSTWREGVLHFEGASFDEIKHVLLENYGIELRFLDQEKTALINLRGSFPIQNIDILLEAISNVTNTYMRKEKNLIIYQ